MFIIELNYKVPLTEIDAHLEAHRHFLDAYYASGHFIASGPKNPRTGGIILAAFDGQEALNQALCQDPFYIHHLADYKITEFNPNKGIFQK
ncbi:MAG: GTP cyclohydrolase [Bacteroidetes bacterium]|nr:GTP cyclohydrolase [Bacteroidota bacterium]